MQKGKAVIRGSRECTKCSQKKQIEDFVKSNRRRLGILSWCKECDKQWRANYRERNREVFRERNRKWVEKNKEYLQNYGKQWRANLLNKERSKKWNKERRQQIKLVILSHYGGKCKCCSEDRVEFLAIDHINGGGGKQRKKVGAGNFLKWIIRNDFPKDLRILCHNCNAALAYYGYCPHRKL